jgi:ribonuclease HII
MAPRTASSLAPENDLRLLEDRFSVFKDQASLAEPRGHWVIGLDEVGRGCLAGPVVAAAFAYKISSERMLWKPAFRVTDSKKLSAAQRQQTRGYLQANPEFIHAVAEASAEEIDRINILKASLLAMKRAYDVVRNQIPESAHVWALIDGNTLAPIDRCERSAVVKGDSKSFAIAAAAILAKEHRDSLMKTLSEAFPEYNWAQNVGYPTPDHASGLQKIGVSPWHRKSFRMSGLPLHEFCGGLFVEGETSRAESAPDQGNEIRD